jgi:hypothetical protein
MQKSTPMYVSAASHADHAYVEKEVFRAQTHVATGDRRCNPGGEQQVVWEIDSVYMQFANKKNREEGLSGRTSLSGKCGGVVTVGEKARIGGCAEHCSDDLVLCHHSDSASRLS